MSDTSIRVQHSPRLQGQIDLNETAKALNSTNSKKVDWAKRELEKHNERVSILQSTSTPDHEYLKNLEYSEYVEI